MSVVVAALSLVIAGLGAAGLASPRVFVGLTHWFGTPGKLLLAGAIRVVFGVALFLAAPESRAPQAFQIFGVLVVLIGFITPLLGQQRATRWLEWWASRPDSILRAWAATALAMGLLLLYGISPP